MRALLLAAILAGLVLAPVSGQLSDKTGLNNRLYVDAGGQEFEILVTANYDVSGSKFDLPQKTLTINIISGIGDNLGEITIPRTLLDGRLTAALNDHDYEPVMRSNDRIWFITTEFNGTGTHTLQITGTESVSDVDAAGNAASEDSGCLIATAAYGSEMAPQVQLLREIRDNVILRTQSGSAFMAGFNQIYYVFSPTVADWERQNPAFQAAVRAAIAPMIATLGLLNHADIDSELDMMAYGLGIIALGAGIYIGPVAGLALVKRRAGR